MTNTTSKEHASSFPDRRAGAEILSCLDYEIKHKTRFPFRVEERRGEERRTIYPSRGTTRRSFDVDRLSSYTLSALPHSPTTLLILLLLLLLLVFCRAAGAHTRAPTIHATSNRLPTFLSLLQNPRASYIREPRADGSFYCVPALGSRKPPLLCTPPVITVFPNLFFFSKYDCFSVTM